MQMNLLSFTIITVEKVKIQQLTDSARHKTFQLCFEFLRIFSLYLCLYFLGESVQLNVQSCTSMPRGWNQRVSSLLLMSRGCIELHESRICRDADPMMISNPAESSQLFDLNGEYEFNDRAMALKPCSFDTRSVAAAMPIEDDGKLNQ